MKCKQIDTSFPTGDGVVRLYHSDSPMVSKAIRGLGSEVETVTILQRHGANGDDVWIAIEHKVCEPRLLLLGQPLMASKALLFRFDSPKMILTLNDATETLQLGDSEEEALNEVSHL